jgi:hypothetical protein
MGSPALHTLQDPILLLPWVCFRAAAFQTQNQITPDIQEVEMQGYWEALETGSAHKWAVRWESMATSDLLVASATAVLTAGAELASNPWRQAKVNATAAGHALADAVRGGALAAHPADVTLVRVTPDPHSGNAV